MGWIWKTALVSAVTTAILFRVTWLRQNIVGMQ